MLKNFGNFVCLSLLLPNLIAMASVFITHGGGPMPLIYKEDHVILYKQFQDIQTQFPRPKAILLFSAHWEEN